MKKFPKTVYIKIEHEREPEDDFLIADEDLTAISEKDSTVEIGVYDFVMTKKAINGTHLED